MSRRLWPIGEAAQADYEVLRKAVLSGEPLGSLAAARFARRGLAGLIAWPVAEPVYTAVVVGAARPFVAVLIYWSILANLRAGRPLVGPHECRRKAVVRTTSSVRSNH